MSDESAAEATQEEGAVEARDETAEVEARDEEAAPPILDPLATAAEADVLAVETFASRADWLGKASFAASSLTLVLALVALAGRADAGLFFYLGPLALANVAIGVLLRRASVALADAARTRLSGRTSLMSGLRELHKVLGVQLLATGFLVFLLVVALLVAAAFQRATEI